MLQRNAFEKYLGILERDGDEGIVALAKSGDEYATEFLMDKYKVFVRVKAKSYFLVGADREDVIQEGMLGLYKAIRDFNADKLSSFRAFVELCITRQIITAVKTATRQKHIPLNSYISLNKPIYDEDSDRTLEDTLPSLSYKDPEEEYTHKQLSNDIRERIMEVLSEYEAEVLSMYLDGLSYQEIAKEKRVHTKSIDNALQRAKKKIEKHLGSSDQIELDRRLEQPNILSNEERLEIYQRLTEQEKVIARYAGLNLSYSKIEELIGENASRTKTITQTICVKLGLDYAAIQSLGTWYRNNIDSEEWLRARSTPERVFEELFEETRNESQYKENPKIVARKSEQPVEKKVLEPITDEEINKIFEPIENKGNQMLSGKPSKRKVSRYGSTKEEVLAYYNKHFAGWTRKMLRDDNQLALYNRMHMFGLASHIPSEPNIDGVKTSHESRKSEIDVINKVARYFSIEPQRVFDYNQIAVTDSSGTHIFTWDRVDEILRDLENQAFLKPDIVAEILGAETAEIIYAIQKMEIGSIGLVHRSDPVKDVAKIPSEAAYQYVIHGHMISREKTENIRKIV